MHNIIAVEWMNLTRTVSAFLLTFASVKHIKKEEGESIYFLGRNKKLGQNAKILDGYEIYWAKPDRSMPSFAMTALYGYTTIDVINSCVAI